MRLTSLYVSKFLGAAAVELQLHTPIHLFAGRNGAGKSSVRDAIALALTADLGRVSLKKDAPQLIHAGADGACCEVGTADGNAFGVTISAAGKITDSHKGREPSPTLPFVLDAQRFARLDATERRAFLFNLVGVKAGQQEIAKRLKAKGCDDKKVERILPLLRAGFDAGSKQAKASATEAKGAWRAITGETYGSEKAKIWRASVPTYDAAAAATVATELQHIGVAIDGWQQKVGALQAEAQRRTALRQRLPALEEHAGKVGRIEAKLANDRAGLADAEQALAQATAAAGQGERVGLIHELAESCWHLLSAWPINHNQHTEAAGARLNAYEREFGPLAAEAGDRDAAARLPELKRARDLMDSAVFNSQRDLAAALKARDEVQAINAELAETFDAVELESARAQIETLETQRKDLQQRADALKAAKAAADAAEKKTKDAAVHADDVAAWDAIGDALSPDGIPAEILAEAMTPINKRLADSAADTTWPHVEIGRDMAITADGRAYGLLSESEKYRADAMLAEAIAHLSGTRLLVLDRVDVLDVQGRGDLVSWLHILADAGEIDTALLFGTFKAEPSGLPDTFETHWIENGVVAKLQEAA